MKPFRCPGAFLTNQGISSVIGVGNLRGLSITGMCKTYTQQQSGVIKVVRGSVLVSDGDRLTAVLTGWESAAEEHVEEVLR